MSLHSILKILRNIIQEDHYILEMMYKGGVAKRGDTKNKIHFILGNGRWVKFFGRILSRAILYSCWYRHSSSIDVGASWRRGWVECLVSQRSGDLFQEDYNQHHSFLFFFWKETMCGKFFIKSYYYSLS